MQSLSFTESSVAGLLKQFKTRGDKRLSRVTVRHLLQHSAGWDRDVAGDAVFWTVPAATGVKVTSPQYNAHLLQYVLNRKLQFTPGICLIIILLMFHPPEGRPGDF